MNILYLLGNGFDINLDLETRYANFYKYYLDQESPTDLIKKLKEYINDDDQNWSDLELELGQYTSKIKSNAEFLKIYTDIQDHLGDYLQQVELNSSLNGISKRKLFNDLTYPENSLPPKDKDRIKVFRKPWNKSQWNIDIITFNYTKTIEKLTEYSDSPIRLNEFIRRTQYPVLLNQIVHVHGFTDSRMVMGVNDTTQVSNTTFHNDQIVLDSLVKSDCYIAQKQNTQDQCADQISKANLICIFGSSIGDTDNLWWERIGDQLKNNCILIIFEAGELISPRRPQLELIKEDEKREYFLEKTQLTDDEKENVRDNIYIRINSNMFQFHNTKK